MPFKKGHKINLGRKTGSQNQGPKREKQLYGDYRGFTPPQIEYIKLKADPETELKKLTQTDIANILGIKSLKTIYNWSINPIIRDAIVAEKQRESAEVYPSMLKVLEDIALGRGRKGSTDSAKVRAAAEWMRVCGYYNKSKDADVEKMSEKDKSFERKLMAIAGESSRDSS